VTYSDLMSVYSSVAGLPRRWLLRVPVLTPRLSSLWVGLVTPIPVPLARALVDSLTNEVVVEGRSACEVFSVHPMPLRDAIAHALAATDEDASERAPRGALDAFRPTPLDPSWSGGTRFSDVRSATAAARPADVFRALEQLGGSHGWYSAGWLWRLRGVIDQLLGGPGLRRGRPEHLSVGSALDFWRIEAMDPGRRLRLRAEMRLPGRAWLTWDLEPEGAGALVTQTACFRPRGLLGRLYWLAVLPFHRLVFPKMLQGLVASSENEAPSVPAQLRDAPTGRRRAPPAPRGDRRDPA
jgi:uncharacterized protein DUF2867